MLPRAGDLLLVSQIHAGDLPLAVALRHQASPVIVRHRTPEIGFRRLYEQLPPRIAVGDKPSVQGGKQRLELLPADADIVVSAHHRKGLLHTESLPGPVCRNARACLLRTLLHPESDLPERRLMSGLSPEKILSQAEGHDHAVDAGFLFLSRELLRQRECPLLQRLHGDPARLLRDDLSVPGKPDHTVKLFRVHKEVPVFHRKGSLLRVDRHRDILVIIFYILHLR